MRHRSRFDSNLLWTHHEKVVVVDQQLAIVGGLDLCIGRYDDWQHRLADPESAIWKGQDYYNPRIKDVTEGRLQSDLLARERQPRLPWQDVACEVLGRAARDVARHCVERWNHARYIGSVYEEMPVAVLRRKVAVGNEDMLSLPAQPMDRGWPPERGRWRECRAQVVRSVGRWSAGTKTESSTHQARPCGWSLRASRGLLRPHPGLEALRLHRESVLLLRPGGRFHREPPLTHAESIASNVPLRSLGGAPQADLKGLGAGPRLPRGRDPPVAAGLGSTAVPGQPVSARVSRDACAAPWNAR